MDRTDLEPGCRLQQGFPGCAHCYAEVMARRLKAMGVKGYENGFRLTLLPERLEEPISRKRPTVYFVNSMSDLFHEEIPDSYLLQVLAIIRQTPQHTFQILTKRAERMAEFFRTSQPPAQRLAGSDRRESRSRIAPSPYLRRISAPVRFISAEPLLEDLGRHRPDRCGLGHCGGRIRSQSPANETRVGYKYQAPV